MIACYRVQCAANTDGDCQVLYFCSQKVDELLLWDTVIPAGKWEMSH